MIWYHNFVVILNSKLILNRRIFIENEMFCLQVLVVGDSITRLLPTTAPGIDVKTFPGIDSERLLKEVG